MTHSSPMLGHLSVTCWPLVGCLQLPLATFGHSSATYWLPSATCWWWHLRQTRPPWPPQPFESTSFECMALCCQRCFQANVESHQHCSNDKPLSNHINAVPMMTTRNWWLWWWHSRQTRPPWPSKTWLCAFRDVFRPLSNHINTVVMMTMRIWQPVPNDDKDLVACANNNNNNIQVKVIAMRMAHGTSILQL